MLDSEIVDLYWLRDETAIKHTKEKYDSYLEIIALNILTVKQDAEECVNDTYLTAWESIPPQKPKSLRAWLGRVVRNSAIDIWRKNNSKKRYVAIELLIDELEQCIPDERETPEEQIENIRLSQLINLWLRTLSPEDCIIFVRRYWYGVSLKALAKETGFSYNKLNSKVFRLRKQLKDYLESEEVYL